MRFSGLCPRVYRAWKLRVLQDQGGWLLVSIFGPSCSPGLVSSARLCPGRVILAVIAQSGKVKHPETAGDLHLAFSQAVAEGQESRKQSMRSWATGLGQSQNFLLLGTKNNGSISSQHICIYMHRSTGLDHVVALQKTFT